MDLAVSAAAQEEVPGRGKKQQTTSLVLLLKIQNKIHCSSQKEQNLALVTALLRSGRVSQSSTLSCTLRCGLERCSFVAALN